MRSFALALRAHRSYFADAALQAAIDLDLPELFADPQDPREVAAAHGFDLSRLQRLGRALAELDQLEQSGDGRWRWLGGRAPVQPQIRQGWGLLSQVIRTRPNSCTAVTPETSGGWASTRADAVRSPGGLASR